MNAEEGDDEAGQSIYKLNPYDRGVIHQPRWPQSSDAFKIQW